MFQSKEDKLRQKQREKLKQVYTRSEDDGLWFPMTPRNKIDNEAKKREDRRRETLKQLERGFKGPQIQTNPAKSDEEKQDVDQDENIQPVVEEDPESEQNDSLSIAMNEIQEKIQEKK